MRNPIFYWAVIGVGLFGGRLLFVGRLTKICFRVDGRQECKDWAFCGVDTVRSFGLRFNAVELIAPDVVGMISAILELVYMSVEHIFSIGKIGHRYLLDILVAPAGYERAFRQVGFVIVTGSDWQSVCALVSEDKRNEASCISLACPIALLGDRFEHRSPLAIDNLFMSHSCGFTRKVLIGTVQAAAFVVVVPTQGDRYYSSRRPKWASVHWA